ncbi:hypothetical protein VTK73DRAFT_2223 [Phialemonium thermophilum]|uniref:Xylanolytic transcriptional activator regulatory domain-containing protein n=1 Tax=Phialemonium thermophilum TaxID=223376 RepID=A0ABR3Y2T3_9PEZI
MDFQYDLAMDGSEYQFLFRPPHSPSSEISAIGSSFGVIPAQSVSPQPTGPGGGSRHGALSDDWKVANAENLGLSGDMDPYLLQRYKADIAGVFKFKQLAIHAVQETPVPIQFLVSQPSLFSQSREETGHVPASQEELRFELEQIVSIEMGHRLIDLFDRFVAPQYPIFARHDVPNPSLTPPHLLGAIYSIAFPFSMYDDKLCIDLAYDTLPYPALSRLINQGLAGELYSPSLAGVQTLLLLVARPSSNYLISDASYRWTTLGLLVASAVNLGLHLDPSNWNVKPWQVALRRRLSFIIYALDRWLAASLGRPPHIDQANWLVTSVEMTDNLDSGLSADQWVNMLDFSALTSVLTTTLSKL